tara:strand:- start:56 stop:370 length:315 start_codon:yes stop_codon:yes gene_type:complete
MKSNIKKIITSITPVYESSSSYQYPMPNEITLFLDDSTTYVEINLKDNVLCADVSHKEIQIELNSKDLDFLYSYLESLLAEEIDLTQRYYDEQSYEQQTNYYIR